MTKNPTPILLDRIAHVLSKHGVKLKRQQLLETAAYAFGCRSSDEFSAAAKNGDINPPYVLPIGRISLPSGETLLVVRDPLAKSVYGIDEAFVEQVVEDERRERIGVTPYGHLVRLDELAIAVIQEIKTSGDETSLPADTSLAPFLETALRHIDQEIESRKHGGDPEAWRDLQSASDLGHAALRQIPIQHEAGDPDSVAVSREQLQHVLGAAEAYVEDVTTGIEEGLYEESDNEDISDTEKAIEDLRLRLAMKPNSTAQTRSTSTCVRCDSPLIDERCSDETCPFSDVPQSDPRGWEGHPETPVTSAKALNTPPFSADHADEIASVLEGALSSDIWYDAHEHGSADPKDPDRIAERKIERIQAAMAEAAFLLRTLKPQTLPNGSVMVDGLIPSPHRIAMRASDEREDRLRVITDADGEPTGDVTITMIASAGLNYHNDRGDSVPLTDKEIEYSCVAETLNAHLDQPIRLGSTAFWKGQKWLAPYTEFSWDSMQDGFVDNADNAFERAQAYRDHVKPMISAMGGHVLLQSDVTDFAHEVTILLPFELAFQSASTEDWKKALAYLLLTEKEKGQQDQVSCEYTAEVDFHKYTMSVDPLGDTIWDATFDALRWGTKEAIKILTGENDPDEYAYSPLAPEWVREWSNGRPFSVQVIGLERALRIIL